MPRLVPRTYLICLALFAVINGCKPPHESGSPGAYSENGVAWAYGSVQLTDLDAPGTVMIRRLTGGQSVNTPTTPITQTGGASFQLFGAVRAGPANAGERDLAYVDYHPTLNKLLAYAYQVSYEPRAPYTNVIDVFAILRKGGRSYYNREKVWLGTATFAAGAAQTAVALADGLKMSLIADGVFAGQWALHYPEVQSVVVKPWQGMCPKGVSQMPGQNPSQNPGQWDSCRPLPAQNDLCNGDPTKAGCRPTPPVQQLPPVVSTPSTPVTTPVTTPVSGQTEPEKVTTDLTVISADQSVFQLEADVKEAKVVFTSATMAAASDDANTADCAQRFYAVARTVGNQVNTACVLKPAPATMKDGKLTCALTVSFDNAQTYLERVCDIAATFRGAQDETQHIQVLKK